MDVQLLFISFIAGVLTILAPCVFPLLPILIGSTADAKANSAKAFRVIGSLLASITILTLLIHGTSNFFNINEGVLRFISASLLLAIGFVTVFPDIWERVSMKMKLGTSSNSLLAKAMKKDGATGDVLVGAALGPVFSSCSPTYGLIIATILPVNFLEGVVYLFLYILGLGIMFVLLALLGRKFTAKLVWATDPHGWFKRILGLLFLLLGVAILFNLDKSFETWLLSWDFYTELVNFELQLQ